MPMRIRVPGYDRSIARHEPHLEDHLQDIQNDVRDSFWLCARVYCLQLGWNALSYMEVAPTWFPDLKIFASQEARQEAFRDAITLVGSPKFGRYPQVLAFHLALRPTSTPRIRGTSLT